MRSMIIFCSYDLCLWSDPYFYGDHFFDPSLSPSPSSIYPTSCDSSPVSPLHPYRPFCPFSLSFDLSRLL